MVSVHVDVLVDRRTCYSLKQEIYKHLTQYRVCLSVFEVLTFDLTLDKLIHVLLKRVLNVVNHTNITPR